MMLTAIAMDQVQTLEPEPIPTEVAMVMSALEAGSHALEERRMTRREPYRVATRLRLFRDQPVTPGWLVYTRDVNRRGMGFITRHRLPLGYGGVIVLPDDQSGLADIHCTLLRCREATPGWFEGSVYFNREQPQFDL